MVSNPTGAFLPTAQPDAEKRFRDVLNRKWGISFNNLYQFANVPLGRFREWLIKTNNLEDYVDKLSRRFNPSAVSSVMCRHLISIDWQGNLHDCDFNLAIGIDLGGRRIHVTEMVGVPIEGTEIAVADHCYACRRVLGSLEEGQ